MAFVVHVDRLLTVQFQGSAITFLVRNYRIFCPMSDWVKTRGRDILQWVNSFWKRADFTVSTGAAYSVAERHISRSKSQGRKNSLTPPC
ncbi:hypothetical protein THAOC_31849 [Thalassiosira oceanica]|uniref:Uncharacterized protein n=1 Tax=Thalassiosira oceanica TaxID=159749 RepID=K0RRM4_THAOC|nr:hypothetical protein THAOC_31849 [Thalassiosira oceanica]|eukprot:EJK49297.1 hypothetical protein THAOC_31849 [Thalassiosira oceanica]